LWTDALGLLNIFIILGLSLPSDLYCWWKVLQYSRKLLQNLVRNQSLDEVGGGGGGWVGKSCLAPGLVSVYICITAVFNWGKLFLPLLCLHWPVLKGECSNRWSVGTHSAIILLYWMLCQSSFLWVPYYNVLLCWRKGVSAFLLILWCRWMKRSGLLFVYGIWRVEHCRDIIWEWNSVFPHLND
jgi:hypothetical protein